MLLSGLISMPLRKMAVWEAERYNTGMKSQSSSDDDMKDNVYIKPQELVGL